MVTAERGAAISRSTAPASSRSRALTAYPQELLAEPLRVNAATVSYRPGSSTGDPPTVGEPGTTERASTGFEALVSHVQKLGMRAVALTDHANMFGAVRHWKKCKAAGLQPIRPSALSAWRPTTISWRA